MPSNLGVKLGQWASVLKILLNIALGLVFLLAPADLLIGLGFAHHDTLTEWLLWPALMGLSIFYALLLVDQLPRRRVYVVAVLESSTTALVAALYAFTHSPLNLWTLSIAALLALPAAMFWYALADS